MDRKRREDQDTWSAEEVVELIVLMCELSKSCGAECAMRMMLKNIEEMKREKRRPRSRWMDNVEEYLK